MSKAKPKTTPIHPWQIGELQPGDEVTLAEDCFRGGTASPIKVPQGTRIKIAWHQRGRLPNGKLGPAEATAVEIWDEWEDGYPTKIEDRGPFHLSSKARIGNILSLRGSLGEVESNERGVDDVDPLHRTTGPLL